MSFRIRLLFGLPLIAILAAGCSESTSSTPKTPPPGPVVGAGAKQAKPATGKRKPKEMGSFTGPEAPVE
jgi:hypothetical protein